MKASFTDFACFQFGVTSQRLIFFDQKRATVTSLEITRVEIRIKIMIKIIREVRKKIISTLVISTPPHRDVETGTKLRICPAKGLTLMCSRNSLSLMSVNWLMPFEKVSSPRLYLSLWATILATLAAKIEARRADSARVLQISKFCKTCTQTYLFSLLYRFCILTEDFL